MLEKIIQAGVVGAGGAGFPTHVKYMGETEYFILNAAECEPLIHSDKYLIRERAQDIVDTMLLISQQIKASKCVIAIKREYHTEIEALKQAIGTKSISLHLMDSFYPAGDEQVIIYEVTGKRVPPGKIPKDVGATVSNICTICDVADALNGIPNTNKVLSIMGEVNNPSIAYAPIGTKVMECLNSVGLKLQEFSLIVGGPMMGKIYDSKDIDSLTITKTTNSLIVLPKDHYLLKRQNNPLQHMINQANSACIQCRECTELCPRFLIGQPIHPHRVMRAIAYGNIETNPAFEESLLCCECGTCDYVCPMSLSPRRINQAVKQILMGNKKPHGDIRDAELHREYRKLSTKKLGYMLDVHSYKSQIPNQNIEIKPSSVWIALKQHIGAPSIPVFKIGDAVHQGELIASIPDGALGANIHASIEGTIREITDKYICISQKG